MTEKKKRKTSPGISGASLSRANFSNGHSIGPPTKKRLTQIQAAEEKAKEFREKIAQDLEKERKKAEAARLRRKKRLKLWGEENEVD